MSSLDQPGGMGWGLFWEAGLIRKDALMHAQIIATPDQSFGATVRRAELLAAHDDLDNVIAALANILSCDDQLLSRLKKRKLQLKDEIAALIAA